MNDSGARPVYLASASTDVERAIIDTWVAARVGSGRGDVVDLPSTSTVGGGATAFERCLLDSDDPLLCPVAVVWQPKERDGERKALARDLLLGDPRKPPRWRQELLRRRAPHRHLVIAGAPARVTDLRARHAAAGSDVGDEAAFARFVVRQAVVALEQARHRAVGAQYKVPKLVREEILESPRFSAGVTRLARELGLGEAEVRARAVSCLDEMVAGYSLLLLDVVAQLGRLVTRPGYGEEIDYDPAQVAMVRDLFRERPAVVLPSHKSQLDALVMARALRENGLPPTHIFAGKNMDIWPFGPLMRRAGRIFIRRSMKDDAVYRWVLREYLGYLTEKRFALEWYIEGGRSRTGKLLPPKFGLLRYLVDAYSDGRTDDVALLPVSIIYDELHEVSEFAAEAGGAVKKAEGLGWAIRYYRAQRRRFGKVYVRFGEPVSLRAATGGPGGAGRLAEETAIDLQKIAFEVSWRINQATPITATAMVCLVLLATRSRALTLAELRIATKGLLNHVRDRRLPLAGSADRLATKEGLQAVLGSLVGNHTIECHEGGEATVYRVAPGQHLSAAFYRNTALHFFVDGAIAEVALLCAAEAEGDRPAAFWDEAYRLRDLLKFEFFFEQRADFRKTIATHLTERLPAWEGRLADGADPLALLEELQPLLAFAVLRPFVEAYGVVIRALVDHPPDEPVDEKTFLPRCLALGRQLAWQEQVRSPESVSKLLFATGLQLAANRELTRPGPDVAERRAELAAELADLGRRIDLTEELTYAAVSGLMSLDQPGQRASAST